MCSAVLNFSRKIRLWFDLSHGVNDQLEDYCYPQKNMEDVLASLPEGKYFFSVDLKEAFLQIPVREKDRDVLTMNTHLGLYRWNRLCYGIKNAPAICEEIIDKVTANMPNVRTYMDDILISRRVKKN